MAGTLSDGEHQMLARSRGSRKPTWRSYAGTERTRAAGHCWRRSRPDDGPASS